MARPPTKPPTSPPPANPSTRPPTSGSTTRPPISGTSTRPPISTSTRPPTALTSTRPPISVSQTRPPTSGPGSPSAPPAAGSAIPRPATSLDEVERALSVLDGRHHDSVRVQREMQIALETKRAAFEAEAERADARARRWAVVRVVVSVVVIAGLGAGGFLGNRRYRQTLAFDQALAALAAPYAAAGFQANPRPLWQARGRIELSVAANTCVLALGSTASGAGALAIERPKGALHATTSAAYCTCNDERIVVRGEQPDVGVQALTVAARNVGGNGALGFLSPRPTALPVTEGCPADPLDAWLASGHGASAVTAEGVAPATQKTLEDAGFKLVASAPATLPFAVVPGAADSCFVATSTTSGEALALRMVGGEKPLRTTPGEALAIAWCSHAAEPVTVARDGTGNVVVFRVGSAAVAGTLGLREVVARSGLGDPAIWAKPTERGWDASAPLVASGVALADITLPTEGRTVPRAQVVSLMLGDAKVGPEPDDATRYACTPSLSLNPRDALCVQSSSLAWRSKPGPTAGFAEAPLPFWMDVLTRVDDPRGLAVELQLLTLSRRLRAQHYEPTARDGVVEEKNGVAITGRVGDDRIIAIGLMNTAPWVLPYTDDAAWTLDGDPHSIQIAPTDELHLVTLPAVTAAADTRRTVVFRRRAGTSQL